MERAEGADEGPERSQARTKQRNQAKGAMMIGLSTTRTSIYGGHMMWLCNGWRRGPEARYSMCPPQKKGDFHVACKRRLK